MNKCQNYTGSPITCRDQNDINLIASNTRVMVGIAQQYFDSDDYESPIKRIFDSRFVYKLLPKLHKQSDLFIRKTDVALYDNILNPDSGEEYSYYSVENFRDDFELIGSTEPNLLTVTLLQDSVTESFERRVYSIMDLFGQLGGIYGILTVIGGYLVNSF